MGAINKDLGWIRFNFKKAEDRALEKIKSRTKLAPVDWYEKLDEKTKAEYNQEVLDRTTNTYSAIYKFSPEEEKLYRDRFDLDYTTFIKDPIAAHEAHKAIIVFIQELIGDYRWDEWLTKQSLNENEEDLYQRKIKSWALFSNSILEREYGLIDDPHELDAKWNELSAQAISPDQQFAIDYFYNYRKMQLGLDYNDKLIGRMELGKTINEIKEAALGFKPDATSRARSSVETMMSNLDKTMEYLQGNAFVKTYNEEDADRIKELTNQTGDAIGNLLQLINTTPDTKSKGLEEIKLKNYKPLKEERTSTVSKSRAKSELKQMLQGKRDDGMGKSTLSAVLAIDKDGKETKISKLEDFNKFEKGTKFALKEMDLDKTWADTFGDRSDELAAKQKRFANKESFKKGDSVVVDKIVGMTHSKQSDARRFNGKKGIVNGTQGDYVSVKLKGFKSPNIEFHKNELKLAESVNEDDVDEGTCGYSKDGKPKSKPAGPHLITKSDLKEKIVNMIKKYQ